MARSNGGGKLLRLTNLKPTVEYWRGLTGEEAREAASIGDLLRKLLMLADHLFEE